MNTPKKCAECAEPLDVVARAALSPLCSSCAQPEGGPRTERTADAA